MRILITIVALIDLAAYAFIGYLAVCTWAWQHGLYADPAYRMGAFGIEQLCSPGLISRADARGLTSCVSSSQ